LKLLCADIKVRLWIHTLLEKNLEINFFND
jgi:hypothetical protein